MPVEFWAAADSKVLNADQAVPTEYFYHALRANLSKSFTLVDQTGPGVMTLRVALMDATTAVPGLRTVSVIALQARVLNLAQSMATDSYAFVGSAEAEMKMTDSIAGEALSEAVDQRAGGMGIKSAASFQWGDAQNAMGYWGQKIPNRILQLQEKSTTAPVEIQAEAGTKSPKFKKATIIKISRMQNLIATMLAFSAQRVEGRVAAEAAR